MLGLDNVWQRRSSDDRPSAAQIRLERLEQRKEVGGLEFRSGSSLGPPSFHEVWGARGAANDPQRSLTLPKNGRSSVRLQTSQTGGPYEPTLTARPWNCAYSPLRALSATQNAPSLNSASPLSSKRWISVSTITPSCASL